MSKISGNIFFKRRLIQQQKKQETWLCWTHLNNILDTFRPYWTILDPIGPLTWCNYYLIMKGFFVTLIVFVIVMTAKHIILVNILYKSENLKSFWLFWTTLEPFWTTLDHFEPYWTIVDLCGLFWLFWTILNYFEQFWTILNNFEPF